MESHKIIFTGPVGAGKTTAIAAISDIEPFTTEELVTDETKERKDNTTVAMDFGMIKLDSGERVHLYGTPGQVRFDFMWEILSEGGLGLIILIDNLRDDPCTDLVFYLDAFEKFVQQGAVAVGVTRMDLGGNVTLRDYNQLLRKRNLNIPVFEVDGREHNDVAVLIRALFFNLDPGLIHLN